MVDQQTSCPCGSGLELKACCGPVIEQVRPAETAERLMRARFSAYALGATDFLLASWDPNTRPPREDLEEGPHPRWNRLHILRSEAGRQGDDRGKVAFIASGILEARTYTLQETSRFRKEDGHWLYIDGDIHPVGEERLKIGRNNPCPCGSGKKYKRCCGA